MNLLEVLILINSGLSSNDKSSLLIYHSCDQSVPAGAIPYGTGFPKLPWYCPLCKKSVDNYAELSFDITVETLDLEVGAIVQENKD